MTRSEEDGKLYYELRLPLLDFTNQKYGVNKKDDGSKKPGPGGCESCIRQAL